MASPVEEFFAAIGRRGHEPLLARATGTIRFEIARGLCTEHWYVSVSKGEVTVSRDNIEADTVVRADREVFDRIVRAEDNLIAAILRGAVSVGGAIPLAVLFQRLLPGPQDPAERRLAAGAGRDRR